MSSRIEVSRELLQAVNDLLIDMTVDTLVKYPKFIAVRIDTLLESLLPLLTAPVVERQQPVAIVTGSSVQWLPGAGSVRDRAGLYIAPPELAELQATIARLTGLLGQANVHVPCNYPLRGLINAVLLEQRLRTGP